MSRVLYLTNGHPRLKLGGAEVYSYDLFQAMREADEFEPVLLARTTAPGTPRRDTPFHNVEEDPNQVLWYLPDFDDLMMTAPDKRQYTYHLRRFLEAYRPDVVHAQHLVGLGVDVLREVKNTLPQVPIVYTLHEFLPICHAHGLMLRTFAEELCGEATPTRCHECFPDVSQRQFFLRERFIKSHFRQVDLFLTPSRFLRERYREWGIPREKIRFLRNGRSLSRPTVRGKKRRRPSGNQIGFFGQLKPHKGIAVLLRALKILREDGFTDVRLFVSGANLETETAEFGKEVAALIKECGTSVTLLGKYDPSEIADRMQDVAWVVVPSIWWENAPLVIQEAFLHRRPVICSDAGGMAEMVTDGVDGLHFRLGDPVDLAEVLRRAITSRWLWWRLRAGIRRVYSMAEAAAEHAKIYRELLEEEEWEEEDEEEEEGEEAKEVGSDEEADEEGLSFDGYPSYQAQPEQPLGLSIDRLIALDAEHVFLRGWIWDLQRIAGELDLVTPSGVWTPLLPSLTRVARPHVADIYRPVFGDLVSGDLGFVGRARVEAPTEGHTGYGFVLRLRGREWMRAGSPPCIADPFHGREEVLRSLPDETRLNLWLLRDQVHPALDSLQQRCRAQVDVLHEFGFGDLGMTPELSMVIPVWKRLDLLEHQLVHLADELKTRRVELLLVLDSPELAVEFEKSVLALSRLYGVTIRGFVCARRSGYAAAAGIGARRAYGRLLVLMHSDVFGDAPGWLSTMADFYDAYPELGVLGAKLLYEDGSVQHLGFELRRDVELDGQWSVCSPYQGLPSRHLGTVAPRRVDAVSGACLMISRELFEQVGGLSDVFVAGDLEDVDLCLRCGAAGYQTWVLPEAQLYHLEGVSRQQAEGWNRHRWSWLYNRWLLTERNPELAS